MRIWILIISCLIVATGAFWFYNSSRTGVVNEKELISVQQVDFPLLVSASGILEATRSVTIEPPKIGRERRFKLIRMVEEGIQVSEGDFLLEFDSADIASRLRSQTASFQSVQEEYQKKRSDSDIQIRQLKLNLEQARADYEKLENKLNQQAELESAITVEETRIRRDAAKTQVEFMEQKLKYQEESARINLQISRSNENYYRDRMDDLMEAMDSLVVRAPVSGVVIYERLFNNEAPQIGSDYMPMMPILQIPDLSSIRAKIQVDEMDAGKIRVGQDANILVDSVQGRMFSGKISAISTILQQATYDRPQKIIEAYVKLEGGALDLLRPGMNLKAQIRVGQYSQALVIPLSSIQERSGMSYVQVWQPEQQQWEWREIQLKTNDGLTAVVDSGLEANEKIRIKPQA